MKQVWVIFLKDARRFWTEILVGVALLVALVLVYPATWRVDSIGAEIGRSRFFAGEGPMGLLAGCIVVLIPIAWLVLIARVVHCERLVGDTQFWLTRPYDWRKLFAAKLLFIAAFLYAPFFVAQCLLLRAGGFHPFHYFGGLMFNLLLLTAVGVLPLMALSSLTTGFGRMMLVLLGVALVIVAAAAGSANVPSVVVSSVPDLVSGNLGVGVLFCGSLAAAMVMYARRRAKTGWMIVIALTLVMSATAFFDPDGWMVNSSFPSLASGAVAPVSFAYAVADVRQPPASQSTDRHAVDISIPVVVSGVKADYVANPQAVRVTMTDARGASWESPWQGFEPDHFLPGTRYTYIRFRMWRSVYDQFKGSPVTVRISIAVTMARKASASKIPLPDSDFAVPEIGVCKPDHWFWRPNEIRGISCRSAMNAPRLTLVSVPWSSGGCRTEAGSTPDEVTTGGWMGELEPSPAEFGITSVWAVTGGPPRANPSQKSGQPYQDYNLCAGAPVSFAQYRPAGRVQEDLTIPDYRLPELAIGDGVLFLNELH